MTDSQHDFSAQDTSTWIPSQGAAGCDIKGEMILLHLQSGTYFGLNSVGAEIWNLLKDGKTSGEIQRHLLERYDVSPSRCETEVSSLLAELHKRDLITKATHEKAA